MNTPVAFTVVAADPAAHQFHVHCTVAQPHPDGQEFRMPSWIRGSYLVRDFAKHVLALRAFSNGEPVAVERLDKRSLRCAPCSGALELEYSVYAFDNSVRKAFLDPRRGFFNGSSLFYCPKGHENAPFAVNVQRPAPHGWKVATAMTPVDVDADGWGWYAAQGYEELIDHPFELGTFERLDFDVDGIPHALVLAGRYSLDRERVTRDLAAICRTERALFGGEPALDRYLFLTNVVDSGYGGLEHRASSALICARDDLPRSGVAEVSRSYRGFLGLCSHEYFHLWNVKRITAQRFLESGLASEAYTRDLWHYEGVTSYYDDLFLRRAGLIDAPTYLDVLAENATRLQRTPGRLHHSLSEASFEAWIKYYQQDENTPNATVSYYVKGALAALCLDLHLRLHSTVTLDDVMRELWRRFGATGDGVPEGGLEALAPELSGLDLKPQLDAWLRGTDELPLREYLAAFGVEAARRVPTSDTDYGGRNSGQPMGAWLGLKLRPGTATVAFVLDGSPARRAGLTGGDQLVALDGLKAGGGDWSVQLARLQPERAVALHYFRGDELMQGEITPETPPQDTWTITLADKAPDEIVQRRRAWLGA